MHEEPTPLPTERPFELSELSRTLEEVWQELRARHPELPAAVILIGPGAEGQGKRLTKLGHWGYNRWRIVQGTDAAIRSELLIAGEALREGPKEVLHVLLHEAAHALAQVRNIKDFSRGGRYHNKRFEMLAAEMGLTCEEHKTYGVVTVIPESTVDAYPAEIHMLALAIQGWRRHPGEPADRDRAESDEGEQDASEERRAGGRDRFRRLILVCGCEIPRKLHMAPKAAAAGPVLCGLCGEAFHAQGEGAADAGASLDEPDLDN